MPGSMLKADSRDTVYRYLSPSPDHILFAGINVGFLSSTGQPEEGAFLGVRVRATGAL